MITCCLQKCIWWLLAADILFLCIKICNQMLCGLSTSGPPLGILSEASIRYAYYVTALSAGKLPYVHPYSSFWYVQPNYLTFPHPAHSHWFPWPTIIHFQNLEPVHQVCQESDVVRYMNQGSMTVVILPVSHWAMTALSMIFMASLNEILLFSFVSDLDLAF